MQNYMITLLLCSALMSALGLFYMSMTPLLAKRYSTKGQYYAWLMIIVGLIIPFRPQFDNSIVNITPTNTITPVIQIGNNAPILSPTEYTVARISALSPSVSLWQVITMIWIAGVVAVLVHYSIKHYRFLTMVKRWSDPITNHQALSLLQTLKKELRISKEIGFRQCLCVGSPMLIGFIHPCILLPKADFEEEELRFILKHELFHYRRKDLWYKLLVLIATALHWFNPVVYMIARTIEVLCEMSCDTEVVRCTDADKRQYYSEAILNVARYHTKLKTNLSTNFYGGKKSMKKRILSIMDTSKKRTGIAVVCAIVLLTLGTGTVFAVNASSESTSNRLENSESEYRWGMNVSSVTNTGELILDYELVCLAYDEDGQPQKINWDLDTLVPTNNGLQGGIVTDKSSATTMKKFIYMASSTSILGDIDDITFADGTVWENPEYEKWISDYEGKSVDIEFLKESP